MFYGLLLTTTFSGRSENFETFGVPYMLSSCSLFTLSLWLSLFAIVSPLVSCLSLSLVCCLLPLMAVSTGKKRNVYYGEDFVEDVVEKLGLEIPEQVLVDLRAMTSGLKQTPLKMAVTIYEVLLNSDLVSGDASWLLKIGKICDSQSLEEEDGEYSCSKKEDEWVRLYRENLSLPPSAITWPVLHRIGKVHLNIDNFISAAFAATQDIECCEFDLEPLKKNLLDMARSNTLCEAFLLSVCAAVFGFCSRLLEKRCEGNFLYELQTPMISQRGFSDLIVLCITNSSSKTVALVEVKTDVPLGMSQFKNAQHSKSLAQLLFMGTEIADNQHFMPLLILTNCCVWHIFELDMKAKPKRYSFVPPGGSLPLSQFEKFDAAAVCSELIAFVLRNETQIQA